MPILAYNYRGGKPASTMDGSLSTEHKPSQQMHGGGLDFNAGIFRSRN